MNQIQRISDLHCHILPGIDDGAEDEEESRMLLAAQMRDGVKQIVFTPHFYADQMPLETFLEKRAQAKEKIEQEYQYLHIEGKLGAEVHLLPQLNELDCEKLCIENTRYLLVEWPMVTYPLWGEEVIDTLLEKGICPIFAHIERYEYFWRNPERLKKYLLKGCLCQVNGTTLLQKELQKRTLEWIREGYVHFICSDAHSVRKRPPQLRKALDVIDEKIGEREMEHLLKNADAVFHGEELPKVQDREEKKKVSFWGWIKGRRK